MLPLLRVLLHELIDGHVSVMRNHLQSLFIFLVLLPHLGDVLNTRLLAHYPLRKLVVLFVYPRRFLLLGGKVESANHADWTADGGDALELMLLTIAFIYLLFPRMDLLQAIE